MQKFQNNNFLEAPLLTCQLFEQKSFLTGLFYVHDTGLLWKKGSYVYLKNGLLHNDQGPAYITSHSLTFAINGEIHREKLPAYEHYNTEVSWSGGFLPSDGAKVLDFKYYKNGYLHRLNGVAVKNQSGKAQYNHYSVLGQKLSAKEYNQHPLVIKERL